MAKQESSLSYSELKPTLSASVVLFNMSVTHFCITEPYNQRSVRKLIQERGTSMAKVTELVGNRIRA